MNKITEALNLAEKTLRDIICVYKFETGTPVTTLAAIREARAEQEKQEPVAMVVSKHGDPESFGERELEVLIDIQALPYDTPFYAAPISAKREWVELTDDELKAALEVHQVGLSVRIGRIAIAAFKEKNK